MGRTATLNVNVGVLGHVDSGKTSLVAALSTTLSTCALDKHPQSKERGITLDLGFSSFQVSPVTCHFWHWLRCLALLAAQVLVPDDLRHILKCNEVQFTLVDCPGHASLIRTILGGVQIIDAVLLVIDVAKGIQTQTAECLVVGEITAAQMVVVLNKVDQLPDESRPKALRKLQRHVSGTLDCTRFAGAPMVPISARPGSVQGVEEVKRQLLQLLASSPLVRRREAPLLMAVDHCFALKGQGTVLTGTVLQGQVAVGQTVEAPALKVQRVVRSMQMFKRPITAAEAGDRVAVCLAQVDPSLMERGLLAAPGTVPTFSGAVVRVHKIRFYSGRVTSGAKFHVSIGHSTVMAGLTCFGAPEARVMLLEEALGQMVGELQALALPVGEGTGGSSGTAEVFDFSRDYLYQEELYGLEGRPPSGSSTQATPDAAGAARNGEDGSCSAGEYAPQWLLLRFEQPVTAPANAVVIGSRLDADASGESCRLAFCGRLQALLDPGDPHQMQRLRVYKVKQRQGVMERLEAGGSTAVCRGMFKRESDQSLFVGLRVCSGAGEGGRIVSSFGKSGKFWVEWDRPLMAPLEQRRAEDNVVVLQFKKYVFDPDKRRMCQ